MPVCWARPAPPSTVPGGVAASGGLGIPVRVDHTVEAEVEALFAQVRTEQGRLDILVNDIWGGDDLTEWGKPFWDFQLRPGC